MWLGYSLKYCYEKCLLSIANIYTEIVYNQEIRNRKKYRDDLREISWNNSIRIVVNK